MIQEKLDQYRALQKRGYHERTAFLTGCHVYIAPSVE